MTSRTFFIGLVIASLLVSTKMHLPVLQVAAWTGMMVVYSQEQSWTGAISDTFSGDKPCPLCVAIKKQQTESRGEWRATGFPDLPVFVMPPPWSWRQSLICRENLALIPARISPGAQRPEVPPPRSVAG